MAFWIFIGIITAVIVIGFLHDLPSSRYDDWFGGAVMLAFVVAVIGLIVCGVGAVSPQSGTWTYQKTWTLRALVTQQSVETQGSATFFLGFGGGSMSSSTVQSISYIRTASDGGSTLQKSSIDDAVIYEDGAKNPRVEDWIKVIHNDKAFVPWDFTRTVSGLIQHRFHIPAGSILQNYEVKP